MVLDHVVHQGNLFIESLSCLGAELLILHGGLDQGQARLQAMGQIIHGVLVAAGLFALIIQQAVEGVGQRLQLLFIAVTQALFLLLTDGIELILQMTQ